MHARWRKYWHSWWHARVPLGGDPLAAEIVGWMLVMIALGLGLLVAFSGGVD